MPSVRNAAALAIVGSGAPSEYVALALPGPQD